MEDDGAQGGRRELVGCCFYMLTSRISVSSVQQYIFITILDKITDATTVVVTSEYKTGVRSTASISLTPEIYCNKFTYLFNQKIG